MAAAAALLVTARPAAAQAVDGYLSLTGDVFPGVRSESGDRQTISELRARLSAERAFDVGKHLRLTFAGIAEGLLADRGLDHVATDLSVEPRELQLEARWHHAEVRVGLSRIVWGRLDELQPTDVVNPLDLARFFFEGRSEARRAVPLIRVRWLPSENFTLEGIYVPWFRRGRFDELDERTSPFNLSPTTTCANGSPPPCVPLPRISDEPGASIGAGQGGVRASFTSGRVDWSVSGYRGFEPLPLYTVVVTASQTGAAPAILERFPRFTMVGGDFETVRGEWGVRGEFAAYLERRLQGLGEILDGRTFEGGLGVDRSAGDYRVSGNVILSRRWLDDAGRVSPTSVTALDRTDLTLVTSVDRSFTRETKRLQAFAVYNPGDASVFTRVIATLSVRDNVSLDISGGLFAGEGADILSRLASRDFGYLRLKVFF
jgi:hypothetical protein